MSLFEAEAAIVVLRCQGEVKAATHGSKPTRKLAAGRVEWPQMLVLTGNNGFADLKLEDGSLARVKENSVVSVDLTKPDESQLDLKKGAAIFVAKRSQPEFKFEVVFLFGICGARSEQIEFAANENGKVENVFGQVVTVWMAPSGVPRAPTVLEAEERTTPRAGPPDFKTRMMEERLDELKAEIQSLKNSEARAKIPQTLRKRPKGF